MIHRFKWAPALVCVALTGCADPPEEYVPVMITPEKAPIVSECNPRTRARFPEVIKIPGNKTPLSNLESAMIDAGKADLKNEVREVSCYCAQLDERGSDEEKAQSKTLCSTVKPKPKLEPKTSIFKSLATKYAGS